MLLRLIALLYTFLAVSVLTVPALAAAQSPAQLTRDEAVILTVEGAITPVAARYIERGLADAERNGARVVVLRLDTPGGLDTAMRDIIQRILVSRVPVITYVSPVGARAASAGTFIAYASHVAAMAPSTTIGSASPVALGGDGQAQPESDAMTAKVMNDAVSFIRGLAERHGRNADWAERAVREAANLTATEALAQDVVDIVATDLEDLLLQAHGRTVVMETGTATLLTEGVTPRSVEPTWIETFFQLIANPTVAYLLLSLALLGLYLEFANPGSILPGVTGAILLIMSLYALGSLPVNWAGLLLMVLAFALFAADIWFGANGVLSLGGLAAFVLGSLLLIDTDVAPGFEIAPAAIISVAVGLAAFSFFVVGAVIRDRHRRPFTGREGLVGTIAVTHTPLNPSGLVFVEGERWTAISQSGPVDAGQPVLVIAVKGLSLLVTPAVETSIPSGKEQHA